MEKTRFEEAVARAIANLPLEFRNKLENIDIVIEDYPTKQQLTKARLKSRESLLGLYEGIPMTKRGRGYNMVLPDKITIFQKPIEANCRSNQEIEREIQRVVYHEIAHHFGISDRRLTEIERRQRCRT